MGQQCKYMSETMLRIQGEYNLSLEEFIDKINEWELINDTNNFNVTYPKGEQYKEILEYCAKNKIAIEIKATIIDTTCISTTISFETSNYGTISWYDTDLFDDDGEDGFFTSSLLYQIDDHYYHSLQDLIDFLESIK